MNGFELAGRPIRVGLGNDKFTPESTQKLLHGFGNQNQQGSSFSGMGGRGAHAGGNANFDRASGRDADRTGGASALDDTDVTGVNFSHFNRDSLMRKLARIDEPEQKVAPKTQQQSKTQIEETAPGRCVLIKNMFDPTEYVYSFPRSIFTDTCVGRPSRAGRRSSSRTCAKSAKTGTATSSTSASAWSPTKAKSTSNSTVRKAV